VTPRPGGRNPAPPNLGEEAECVPRGEADSSEGPTACQVRFHARLSDRRDRFGPRRRPKPGKGSHSPEGRTAGQGRADAVTGLIYRPEGCRFVRIVRISTRGAGDVKNAHPPNPAREKDFAKPVSRRRQPPDGICRPRVRSMRTTTSPPGLPRRYRASSSRGRVWATVTRPLLDKAGASILAPESSPREPSALQHPEGLRGADEGWPWEWPAHAARDSALSRRRGRELRKADSPAQGGSQPLSRPLGGQPGRGAPRKLIVLAGLPVGARRFELRTSPLSGVRSSQLSYAPIHNDPWTPF
jgi:hypothetical protein